MTLSLNMQDNFAFTCKMARRENKITLKNIIFFPFIKILIMLMSYKNVMKNLLHTSHFSLDKLWNIISKNLLIYVWKSLFFSFCQIWNWYVSRYPQAYPKLKMLLYIFLHRERERERERKREKKRVGIHITFTFT